MDEGNMADEHTIAGEIEVQPRDPLERSNGSRNRTLTL